MPKVYRGMVNLEGAPQIGAERNVLGVRPNYDITPDADANVGPTTEGPSQGLSVSPSLSAMFMVHIPRSWRTKGAQFKGARGDENLGVFTCGSGQFVNGPFAEDLRLKCDSARHAGVEPDFKMPFDDYQQALGRTREQWTLLDEPDGS